MSTDQLPKKRGWKEILKVFLILVVLLIILESICFLLIRSFFPDYQIYPYNRIVSGSTIYYNSPGYVYKGSTIKNNESENDLIIDSNGFACNHPIAIEKPEGTIRIFLMGGSAMFGSGQSKPYDQIKKYPSGNYSWEAGIAGCLQHTIDSLCPGKKFEVINASCSGFTTKQSMSLYLEKVCRFSPDYIIEMDGMNDLGNMISGAQTDLNAVMFNSYLELASRNKNLIGINMFKLVQLIQNRILEKKSEKLSQEIILSKLNYNSEKYTLAKYQLIAKVLRQNSSEYLRIINRYEAVLKTDSVKFIFVLQPLLNRKEVNKQLSESEKNYAQKIDPITSSEKDINSINIKNLSTSGLNSYDILHLMLYYHFDNGFADSLKNNFDNNGNVFIDGNRTIQPLDKNFEFFTDYCHLTPEGNKFMAKIIAGEIAGTLMKSKETKKL
jgi:lysophospholipase L1-like esterase